MELSLFLAKVLGLYLVIVCLAVLTHRDEVEKLVKEFSKNDNRLFLFSSGAIILILGLMLVVSHNVWEPSWRGVITLLGWLTVFKGGVRLFAPNAITKSSGKIIKSGWYQILLVVFLFMGVWLAYIGFNS